MFRIIYRDKAGGIGYGSDYSHGSRAVVGLVVTLNI